MKKIIIAIAALAVAVGAQAESKRELVQPKFGDNWRIGMSLGLSCPLQFNYGDPHMILGAEVRKDLSPVWGIGIEGRWEGRGPAYLERYMIGEKSKNFFAGQYVGAFATLNLMNLFGGYNGTPRTFEIEVQGGLGWLHYYYSKSVQGLKDLNSFGTKLGLNFNFNVGSTKAWVIGIRPYVQYDLTGLGASETEPEKFHPATSARFDVRRATFNVEVSAAYKFKCSNGTHNFAKERVYDQAEIDSLNAEVNKLRGDIANTDNAIKDAVDKGAKTKAALDSCEATPKVVDKKEKNLESVVTFAKASSTVANAQLPNVERIATYLKNHKDSKVEIRGYASPEGDLEYNTKLATSRAEAVKNILVKKYKISADRISAEGQGIGDMFSESDWNRVAISTIQEN